MSPVFLATLVFVGATTLAEAEELSCENIKTIGHELPFPSYAARLGFSEGEAVIEFGIGADGRASNPKAVSSSHTVFADAALDAVRQLTCKPLPSAPTVHLPLRFIKSLAPSTSGQGLANSGTLASKTSCICGIPPGIGLASAFPEQARKLGIESGYVRIEYLLTTDLRVTNIRTLDSTHEVFSEAATSLAGQIKCHGIGLQKDIRVAVPFNFELK